MKRLEADTLKLMAELRAATLAGRSEGRGAISGGHESLHPVGGTDPLSMPGCSEERAGRPSLQPTGCDHACGPKCKECARRGRMRDRAAKRAWLRRRVGPAPESVDVFRGFRGEKA